MILTAERKKLLAIRILFRCYYFNATLLPNVNTFLLHRLMSFLAVIYRAFFNNHSTECRVSWSSMNNQVISVRRHS